MYGCFDRHLLFVLCECNEKRKINMLCNFQLFTTLLSVHVNQRNLVSWKVIFPQFYDKTSTWIMKQMPTFWRERTDFLSTGNADDTCTSTPQQKRKSLPAGCHYDEEDVEFTVVDVGQCGQESCQLRAGGTAVAGETYCCQAKEHQQLQITCDTADDYQLAKVARLACNMVSLVWFHNLIHGCV